MKVSMLEGTSPNQTLANVREFYLDKCPIMKTNFYWTQGFMAAVATHLDEEDRRSFFEGLIFIERVAMNIGAYNFEKGKMKFELKEEMAKVPIEKPDSGYFG